MPGPLLYAPAGAIFGGLMGGTLSLIGNVTGAGIASWLGRALGESWVSRHTTGAQAARIRERVVSRGPWVIFLLRINPLTSSDLVSYVAGAMGVPVRHVVIGTLAGMAPLCFAQAFLAASLFEDSAWRRDPRARPRRGVSAGRACGCCSAAAVLLDNLGESRAFS